MSENVTEGGRRERISIVKAPYNKYRFEIRASNGHLLAASDDYSTTKTCLEGLEILKSTLNSPNIMEYVDITSD